MQESKILKEFIRISRFAGMREDLVQAGGGNSAYKIEMNKMVIKASGYQLAEVTESNGYAVVNPQIVRDAFLKCENLDDLTEKDAKRILSEAHIEGARPSIETFLHSISGRYSLHTHSIVVNALTCRKNGKELILKLFPDALVVPYATPGVELAKQYFKEYKLYKDKYVSEPKFVFLMNHGFLTSADTAEEVIELTEFVTQKIEDFLSLDMSAYHNMTELLKLYENGILWLVTDKNVLQAYESIGGIWEHYFCPDCVVFLGKKMYVVPDKFDVEKYKDFVVGNGYPIVIAYKDNLYIHADTVKKALEIQSVLSFSAQVMMFNKGQECELLSEEEKNFLLNWDAEKYRKNMK